MPEARYFCPIFPLGEYSDLTFWTLVSPILPPSEINHEETKSAKKEKKKTFALFVSSWLIFILSPASPIATCGADPILQESYASVAQKVGTRANTRMCCIIPPPKSASLIIEAG